MNDSFGDGWNGGYFEFTDAAGNVFATGGLLNGSAGTVEVDFGGGNCAVYGCTDSTASNFDPAATVDDGSCVSCSDNLVFVDYNTEAFGAEQSFTVTNLNGDTILDCSSCYGSYDGFFDSALCLVDDCYTIDMGDSFGDGWSPGSFIEFTDLAGNVLVTGTIGNGFDGQAQFSLGGVTCPVFGCTDSTALNFDASANTDDGSCLYTCTATPVCSDFDLDLGVFSQDSNDDFDWSAMSGSTPSINTGPTGDNTSGSGTYYYTEASGNFNFSAGLTSQCLDVSTLASPELVFYYHMLGLNQGTMEVYVTDGTGASTLAWSAFGDQGNQWNMAQVSLAGYTGDITIQIVGTTGGGFDSDMAIDDVCITEAVSYGCTDLTALNFDPSAQVDDGSCAFLGCTQAGYDNYDPNATVDDGSCICSANDVNVLVTDGTFPSEISWEIMDGSGNIVFSTSVGSGTGSFDLCLADDCNYSVNMFDSFGDNWNGASLTITDNATGQVYLAGASVSGPFGSPTGISDTAAFQVGAGCTVLGCTDSTAINFDPLANTDDGSCFYTCTAAPWTETFDAGQGTWTQSILDGGDWTLWSGATFSTATGPTDDVTGGGSYFYTESSGFSNTTFSMSSECLDISALTNPCLTFNYHMFGATMGTLEVYVNGGPMWSMTGDQGDQWNIGQIDLSAFAGGNITIEFIGTTGTSFTSDIAIDQISVDECVTYGCTDPNAPNYDPAATADDGSCAYYCNDNELTLNMVDSWGDGWNGNAFTVTDTAGNVLASATLSTGSAGTELICLPDGCYDYSVDGGSFQSEVSWALLDASGATLDFGTCPQTGQIAVGTGFCVVAGCTDSTAINYDASANTDDGSCQYACTAAPYSENFDAGLGTWTQGLAAPFGTDAGNWTLWSGSTTSTATGPTDDVTGGGQYLYVETSGATPGGIYTLSSECIDISALACAELAFSYHMYGATMGTLDVYVNGT